MVIVLFIHGNNNHGDNGEHYARVPLLHWPDRPMSLPVSQKPSLILKERFSETPR
ncbi:unnamed protein product [Arctogadus glacialis]